MKALRHHFPYSIVYVIALVLLFGRCEDRNTPRSVAPSASTDTISVAAMDTSWQDPELVKQQLDSLSNLISAKQAALQKTQQEIANKSAEMQKTEQQWAKLLLTMKRLRQASYLTLGIGAVLILFGLIQMLAKRRSADSDTQSE